MVLKSVNLKGIKAVGYANNKLDVKLTGSRLLSVFNVTENEYNTLLTNSAPLDYLESLKKSHLFTGPSTVLG